MSKEEFVPDWFEGDLPEKSFRSILKWGDPKAYKHPNKGLYREMKQVFGLGDEHFQKREKMGMETVPENVPCKLEKRHVDALTAIVGRENAFTDVYHRLQVGYGKTMIDLMRLRNGIIENIPDIVLHPRGRADLRAIVDYCNANGIPVYVYGGG
jgi:alkyldihydroxyacetonephosphate synthase